MKKWIFPLSILAMGAVGVSQGVRQNRPIYHDVIERAAAMVNDSQAQSFARRLGLEMMNLTWEDTGRFKGSSVGPNISDMTIQVTSRTNGRGDVFARAMPVVRFPNFSDTTTDIDPREFTVLVGNQKDQALRRVSLYDVLENPTRFMSTPHSWAGRGPKTLLAPRDTKALVSAQACFLPVPKGDKATFNPVIFNYQSSPGNPAVLTILATREGTSMTVIDNQRDTMGQGFAWGQRLFHNQGGDRASLTGQRISDFINDGRPSAGGAQVADSALNMVLLIQVPLKHRESRREMYGAPAAAGGGFGGNADAAKSMKRGSDTEAAVIGHGEFEGPFTEFANMPIERDPRFPVRVTVQFYKATSTGIASEADMRTIKQEIDNIYKHGDVVGSLVTGGRTGRVTEYDGPKIQPREWWSDFWRRHESWSPDSRQTAISKLQTVLGRNYMDKPVCDLYLRDVLRPGSRGGAGGLLQKRSGIGF